MPTSVYDPETDDDRLNPGAKHEVDMLEQMYNAPSASNSGSQQLNRRDVGRREAINRGINNGMKTSAAKDENDAVGKFNPSGSGWKPSGGPTKSNTPDDTVGKGYTGKDKPKVNWMGRHKKSLAGWLISLTILGGGGAAVGPEIAGPFEFIHFGKIVGKAFENNENGGDSRSEKLMRYAYYRNSPQNTQLGLLGNRIANKLEVRMGKVGFTSAYSSKFGYLDGYYVDPAKFKGTGFNDMAGKSNDFVKEYFKTYYNADLTTRDGKLFLDTTKTTFRDNLGLTREIQTSTGFGPKVSALSARILMVRGQVFSSWHPMEKIKQKTGRAFEAAFAKREKARIQNGNDGIDITTTNEGGDDENKTKNADDAKAATDELLTEAKSASESGDTTKLSNTLNQRLKAGGILGVTTVCVLHGIAQNIDKIEQEQMVFPLMRIAIEVMALGGQIMFGKVDVDPNQLAEYKKYLYDSKTGKSWTDSAAVQSSVGEKVTGSSKADPKINQDNIIVKLFGDVIGINQVCGVINSAPGAAAQITLGLLGGPISAVSTIAFTALSPLVLDAISHYLAGEPIDTQASGETRGTYAMYGARLAANDQAISNGGQPLTPQQESALSNMNENLARKEFQHKSLAYRLFNPYDYRSLVGSLIDKQKPDPMANVASVAHGILNFGSTIAKMPQTMLIGRSQAADDYDYGFLKYGFTVAEFDNAAVANPYDNACHVTGCKDANITGILQGDNAQKYVDRAKKCFGIDLGLDGSVNTGKPPTYKQLNDDDCKDKSTEWLRIRFFIYDTHTIESMACFLGDAASCAKYNFGSGGGSAFLNTDTRLWKRNVGAMA